MIYDYRLIRDSYFPIIEVIVKHKQNKIRTDALVDSGASVSIFKGEIATALGIEIDSGEKRIFQGASAKLIGYVHIVDLELAGKELHAKIAFSDDLSTSLNNSGNLSINTTTPVETLSVSGNFSTTKTNVSKITFTITGDSCLSQTVPVIFEHARKSQQIKLKFAISDISIGNGNFTIGQFNSSCTGFRFGTSGGWILSCAP